jgi:hypothetical protein
MKSLHAILPELAIFPIFRQIDGSGENSFPSAEIKQCPEEAFAAKIAAAHAAGVAKGAEESCVARAVEIANLKAAHSDEVDSARKRWVEEEGRRSAGQIAATLKEMEARMGDSLLGAMLPLFKKLLPQAAVDELAATLATAMADDFKGPLFLSGPDDLLADIKARLGSMDIEMVCESTPGPELAARSASFAVTTRLQSWIDAIMGAVRE